ncbi:MAG TPA: 4Fe-4S ferredoxin, partial [Spirochaetota bacterium]|nr:4Fe-4S ferredoxin [Spirochaetota bacterium]
MKITMLYFSPSGNTAESAVKIGESLKERCGARVQMIDMTCSAYFTADDKATYIKSVVKPHDILIIGGPVYAHHLQYHVKDMINLLPEPDGVTWGKIAMAFVTYGGISS